MLRIAGQTAEPIGLKFLWTLMDDWGVSLAEIFEILLSNFLFKFISSTGNAGPFS